MALASSPAPSLAVDEAQHCQGGTPDGQSVGSRAGRLPRFKSQLCYFYHVTPGESLHIPHLESEVHKSFCLPGGCEGLGELMQVQSLIAQPVVEPLLSTSKHFMPFIVSSHPHHSPVSWVLPPAPHSIAETDAPKMWQALIPAAAQDPSPSLGSVV